MKTEIYDLNNGTIVLRIGKYVHTYDDIGQLAIDIANYWITGNTKGWDGNEFYSGEGRIKSGCFTYNINDKFFIITLAMSQSSASVDLAKFLLGKHAIQNLQE